MTHRTAIVTGGASGIGLAISRRLAADGATVAIFGRNGAAAEAAAADIQATGGRAIGRSVDVTDRPAISAAVAEVRELFGPPTILVNNAGMPSHGPFLEVTPEHWSRVLAVNLTGTFDCCQVVLPDMLAEGWGRIVNISSSSIHSGAPRLAPYVAAKSGVIGLTKSLALEFAPHGITVNTIPPGFVDSPMLREDAAAGHFSIEEQTAKTPVGRLGQPEDIAATCAFLVSDEAGYITGQIIAVNGGRST